VSGRGGGEAWPRLYYPLDRGGYIEFRISNSGKISVQLAGDGRQRAHPPGAASSSRSSPMAGACCKLAPFLFIPGRQRLLEFARYAAGWIQSRPSPHCVGRWAPELLSFAGASLPPPDDPNDPAPRRPMLGFPPRTPQPFAAGRRRPVLHEPNGFPPRRWLGSASAISNTIREWRELLPHRPSTTSARTRG